MTTLCIASRDICMTSNFVRSAGSGSNPGHRLGRVLVNTLGRHYLRGGAEPGHQRAGEIGVPYLIRGVPEPLGPLVWGAFLPSIGRVLRKAATLASRPDRDRHIAW